MLKDLAAGYDGFMELKGNLEEGTKVSIYGKNINIMLYSCNNYYLGLFLVYDYGIKGILSIMF